MMKRACLPLLLLPILAGCNQTYAVVYREKPTATYKAISDEGWTYRDAQQSAKQLEDRGYAAKGSTIVLTHQAAAELLQTRIANR